MLLKRVLASVFFVIIAVFALPAMAQRGPSAAPTGEPAQVQELGAPSAAPTTSIDASGLGQIGAGGNFSIVESFLRADIVVKTVMVLLLLASLWSWAIIINKWIALGNPRQNWSQMLDSTGFPRPQWPHRLKTGKQRKCYRH